MFEGVLGKVANHSMRPGLIWSLVGHAGAIAALLWLWHPSPAPPEPPPTLIDIVTLPPPQPPAVAIGPRIGDHAGREGPARAGARDSRETTRRIATHPPDPYGSTNISYDPGPSAPANGLAQTGTGAGSGLFGDAYGQLGNGTGGGGIGGMQIPHVSLARAASPRRDYTKSELELPREYSGQSMIFDLYIDNKGHVTKIMKVKSLKAPDVLNASINIARDDSADVEKTIQQEVASFEFWPALDELGKPVASKYQWVWVAHSLDY